jgi:uncharacterized membrane protein YbhN (UPF0104 family)
LSQAKRTITPYRVLLLLALLIGVYFLIPQLGGFRDTLVVIRHASWPWLVVGLVASNLTFFAGAVTQYAAGNFTGRMADIILLQFDGSFVSHFLPFNVGAIDLTARYYQKLGRHQAQAITLATIPIIFGIITIVIMVAIVSPLTLTHFADRLHPSQLSGWWVALAIVGILIGILAAAKYRQTVRTLAGEVLTSLRGINDLRQVGILVAGSVANTLMSAIALLASVMAVYASAALVGILVLYVTALLVSEIAPTPGGIGAIEAVLVLGLVAMGLSLSQAAAATVIFRLLTFWLPIIPGGLALHRLNLRKTLVST